MIYYLSNPNAVAENHNQGLIQLIDPTSLTESEDMLNFTPKGTLQVLKMCTKVVFFMTSIQFINHTHMLSSNPNLQ